MSDRIEKLAMGRVTLTVNDIDKIGAFYERAVGLHRLSSDGTASLYGAGGSVLLELRQDKAARRRSPREAGLFHVAFLLPSRQDLARWTRFAAESHTPVVGASDHGVSEAIYLTDPEGNGVEIYSDRPAPAWKRQGNMIEMPSDALDIEDLLADTGSGRWQGFPNASKVGHVHLQVGAIAPAEQFYSGILGLGITCRYPGGTFFAADGYHHHIATNIWNSRGADVRDYPSTGLASLDIHVGQDRLKEIHTRAQMPLASADHLVLPDPWGTKIVLVA
ncbi:VOC family protein [Pleomorphomonas sp. PLEO]|uniref:VOC family protein n=1 Tax=Pleomorphomonas sp. PLEO TaxID=3239306 RepID=UPI00351ED7EB